MAQVSSTKALKILLYLLLAATTAAAAEEGGAQAPPYDLVVAQDGSGDYATIQEAVSSVRDYRPEGETRILIRRGVYREKLVIPANKTHITLVGEDVAETIITHGDHANMNRMGTFKTYTLLVLGSDFRAENLTIENSAPQLGQAVAVHVEGDRAVFARCRLLGNQDTLFTGNGDSRQLYHRCYIEGTTDFIFGPATAWFEQCTIRSKKSSYITAASTPAGREVGYVLHRCTLTADSAAEQVYLGRPWRAHAAVLFMRCSLGAHIRPAGWHNWGDPQRELTARYAEFQNTGPGADTTQRVPWARQLTPQEAARYTPESALQGCDGWTGWQGVMDN
ncbi:MAG: pectin esterase [Prevotellaceae bacterium]|jgi:pectinesterase|nr:pectin esterase [Prevotellaceae bacterium]